MSDLVQQVEVIHARHRLAFSIAEAIENEFPDIVFRGYDTDKAAKLIELMLPLTYAEAEAEADLMREE